MVMLHTVAALASERVPDIVLSSVCPHHAAATLASLHIQPACLIADRQAGREAAVKGSGPTPPHRFPFIFCHCFDGEMDFVLIPCLDTALVLYDPPLDAPELACGGSLLHRVERSLLRIRPYRRDTDNTDRVDQTHIVFRHVTPL